MPNNLSVIILTKNSGETLATALTSASWADELILIDQGSTDQTQSLADHFKAKVYQQTSADFSLRRNYGAQKAGNPWLLYLDADETISPKLKTEILQTIRTKKAGAFSLTRVNYFLGTKMYPDEVTRLFHRTTLKGWTGVVHESPLIKGEVTRLNHPLIHHTHRSVASMLEKTNQWSAMEAQLRFDAHHPPIKGWRIFRIAMTIAFDQFVVKRVGRFGPPGVIEGLFQIIDKIIVYIKLWELQQA